MKRILVGATLIVAGVMGVAGTSPASADDHDEPLPVQVDERVCQPQDSHLAPTSVDKTTVTVTAPDGKWISGYCVKSGSINKDLGPDYVTLAQPAKKVTITYTKTTDVKEISHYVVFYVDEAIPVEPMSTAPSCAAAGTVEVLTDTDAYTYDYATADGVTTVTVTAEAGYFLVGDIGPWAYPITQLSGEDCDPEVESNPPAATPPAEVVPPAAPTDRPPVLASPAVASAGPVPGQATPPALPETGTASWALALIAMGLVLLGSGFVGFSRRLS